MNRFITKIAIAAVALSTMGAATTTQAHAGSDLKGLFIGAVIAKEIKKETARKHDVAPRHVTRHHKRKRIVTTHHRQSHFGTRLRTSSKHHGSRHLSRGHFKHAHGFRRAYRY